MTQDMCDVMESTYEVGFLWHKTCVMSQNLSMMSQNLPMR